MDLSVPHCKGSDSPSNQRGLAKHQQQSLANGKATNARINIGAPDGSGGGGHESGPFQPSKSADGDKRSKTKTRSPTVPPNPIYPKDLEAWLENCLKDVGAPPLSSSSEFLDYNPSSFNMNKKPPQPPSSAQGQIFSQGFQKTDPVLNHQFNINKLLRTASGLEGDVNVEFASLPPTVNLGNCGDNSDPQDPSRSFRFSDPCLVAPSDNDSKMSGQNTPDQRNLESQIGSNKFLAALLEQLTLLRETNTKIYRNLHETKGMYTPGMMSDVVREVKEAARVREEALLNRVKAMVEERSWSIGEGNLRLMRDLEEVKAQIQHLRSDRKEANKRIAQLEAENKYIRSILASVLNNRTTEIIHENELFRSTPVRKTAPEGQKIKRNSLSLNYGVINHEESFIPVVGPDRSTLQKSPSMDAIKLGEQANSNRRNVYASPESHAYRLDNAYNSSIVEKQPNSDEHLLQMEKDTLDLRRELQEALASKKQAENRIIALEGMVKRLQVKVSTNQPPLHDGATSSSSGGGGSGAAITMMNGSLSDSISQSGAEKCSNLNTITTSQVQGVSPKLSLAGPITDL